MARSFDFLPYLLIMARSFDFLPYLLVAHRQVLLQVTDLVNEDAADLNICDKYDIPLQV
jgi:hypothetical protein